MAELNWTARGSEVEYLTTELNSLANDGSKLGAAINNSSSRDLYMDVEVYLNTIDLSAQTNPAVRIYLLPSSDDTNYDDGGDSTDPTLDHLVAVVAMREANSAHRSTARMIVLPPGYFKLLIKNATGAALNASGNTITHRVYGLETN